MGPLLVSVVLPCLNEAEALRSVIGQAQEGLRSRGLDGEIIVVDNGSTDGSVEIAIDAGARVVLEPRRGYGAALWTGFRSAKGDIVVMGDADGTYPFERLGDLVAPLIEDSADLVLGARLGAAATTNMPLLHRLVGTPALSFMLRLAEPRLAPVTDSQSGFRAFRRMEMSMLRLRGSGMEFASEMLLSAGRAGWRIQEIPTGYRDRLGRSKLATIRDGARHLRLIWRMAPEQPIGVVGMLLFLVGLGPMLVPGDHASGLGIPTTVIGSVGSALLGITLSLVLSRYSKRGYRVLSAGMLGWALAVILGIAGFVAASIGPAVVGGLLLLEGIRLRLTFEPADRHLPLFEAPLEHQEIT